VLQPCPRARNPTGPSARASANCSSCSERRMTALGAECAAPRPRRSIGAKWRAAATLAHREATRLQTATRASRRGEPQCRLSLTGSVEQTDGVAGAPYSATRYLAFQKRRERPIQRAIEFQARRAVGRRRCRATSRHGADLRKRNEQRFVEQPVTSRLLNLSTAGSVAVGRAGLERETRCRLSCKTAVLARAPSSQACIGMQPRSRRKP